MRRVSAAAVPPARHPPDGPDAEQQPVGTRVLVQDPHHVQHEHREPGGIHRAHDPGHDHDVPDGSMLPHPAQPLAKVMSRRGQPRPGGAGFLLPWRGREHGRQGQQQQDSHPQRAGVHRERQDGGHAEQPAADGLAGELVTHDLPGDPRWPCPDQPGRPAGARRSPRRCFAAPSRPAQERRQVDEREPGAVHEHGHGQRRDERRAGGIHHHHQAAAVDAVPRSPRRRRRAAATARPASW